MPNYHLALKSSKEYKVINFSKTEEYKHLNDKSLQDIVRFTGMYIDKYDLKEGLIKLGLLHYNEYEKNNDFVTIYKHAGEIKKLHYGITYQDDLKFFDVGYCKEYILDRIDDINFLTKLCNHYKNNYNQQLNIQLISNYINNCRLGYYNEGWDNELLNEALYGINKLVSFLTHKKKKDEVVLDYKGLRDLAMFLAYDYRKNQEQNTEIGEAGQGTIQKVKEKVKQENTNNQISFKDMGWM